MDNTRRPKQAHTPGNSDHLARLLVPELEKPIFQSLAGSIREFIKPSRFRPEDVTSRPVEVRSIWGMYGRQKKSFVLSTGCQVAAVAAIFILGSTKPVQVAVRKAGMLLLPPMDTAPAQRSNVLRQGGGGDRSPQPAGFGRLPKAALVQFTPPTEVYYNRDPKLAMDPSILAPPDAILPVVNAANYGDPFGAKGVLSNGLGCCGGIGNRGGGNGVRNDFGPGFDTRGGSFGAYRSGTGGVTAPRVVFKREPEYSDEARKAKVSGVVELSVIVTPDGKATRIRVLRSVGMGLDERAVDAVSQWRFEPGRKDGKAAPVEAIIDVYFRLL